MSPSKVHFLSSDKGGVGGEKNGGPQHPQIRLLKIGLHFYVGTFLDKALTTNGQEQPKFKIWRLRKRKGPYQCILTPQYFLFPATGPHICPQQHRSGNWSPQKLCFLEFGKLPAEIYRYFLRERRPDSKKVSFLDFEKLPAEKASW